MPKTTRREQKRFKARFAPTTTNPGLRIVARNLAAKNREVHWTCTEYCQCGQAPEGATK